MTDKKQDLRAEVMVLVDVYARALTDRIAELEAQLEAVGAGGVGVMMPAPAVVGSVALVSTLLLEAEKFWWNDGPEGKTADDMNAAKDAVLRALAAPQLHQIAEPASQWVSVAERLPIQDQEPYQVLSICKKRHRED